MCLVFSIHSNTVARLVRTTLSLHICLLSKIRMYYQILLGVIIMAFNVYGISQPQNVAALNAVTSSVNDFGIEFNKVVAKEVTGNYICSPFSVDILLSMASYGAEGNTKAELERSLHSPTDETVTKNGYQTLIDMLNNTQGVELAVANKIFTADGFEVKHEFKEVTKTYFYSESESLDFLKLEESAQKINDWAAANTKNRINELFKPEDLTDAVMVMANAVYFKGKWARPFDPTLTQSRPFHVDETTTKNVDMMYRSGHYNWGTIKGFNARYIELPYENKNISMFVFLPNEISGLADLEENLDKIDLSKLNGRKSEIELSMPKFKIESKFELKSVLEKMNITDMFSDTADFRRINDSTALKVSKIVQKAFIEVNEEGSEAAAVTGMEIVAYSLPPSLHVDKPFICTIVIKTTGTIQLFNARVMDPTST